MVECASLFGEQYGIEVVVRKALPHELNLKLCSQGDPPSISKGLKICTGRELRSWMSSSKICDTFTAALQFLAFLKSEEARAIFMEHEWD